MSVEAVREYLKPFGLEARIQEFTTSSATVELAAQVLHCVPERIAKTLSFKCEGKPILIVLSGDRKVASAKYKAQFGTKPQMLTAEEALDLVGHAIGGVCPFAVKEGVCVYLDISLKRFETVFPACGSSYSALELTPKELELASGSVDWIDVSQPFA